MKVKNSKRIEPSGPDSDMYIYCVICRLEKEEFEFRMKNDPLIEYEGERARTIRIEQLVKEDYTLVFSDRALGDMEALLDILVQNENAKVHHFVYSCLLNLIGQKERTEGPENQESERLFAHQDVVASY